MRIEKRLVLIPCLALSLGAAPVAPSAAGQQSASEAPVYTFIRNFQPETARLGPAGVSVEYLKAEGVLKVAQAGKGSPAEGLLKPGDLITGADGASFEGRNPFVVIGTAITEAEAADGKLVLDVLSGKQRKSVTVTIPVLGNYGPTWPLDCRKSEKIIAQTASHYAGRLGKTEDADLGLRLPVPALDRRGPVPAQDPRLPAELHRSEDGGGGGRGSHLAQRIQRHPGRRVLPAHRGQGGAAVAAGILRQCQGPPAVRNRLGPLGPGCQPRLRRRRG